jgi:hypothetical protein
VAAGAPPAVAVVDWFLRLAVVARVPDPAAEAELSPIRPEVPAGAVAVVAAWCQPPVAPLVLAALVVVRAELFPTLPVVAAVLALVAVAVLQVVVLAEAGRVVRVPLRRKAPVEPAAELVVRVPL